MKLLNQNHITKIRIFIKSKDVNFHDVQEELVDHLASSVEQKMQWDSNLSFEKAIQEVYKGFGLFGFAEFVEAKQKQTYKKGRNLFFREFANFFKLPQILLTLLVGLFFYLAISSLDKEVMLTICIISLLVPSLYGGYHLWKFKNNAKVELTQAQFGSVFLSGFGVFINVFNITFNGQMGTLLENKHWFLTILATAIFIVLLAQIKAMREVHSSLRLEYPEAFSS